MSGDEEWWSAHDLFSLVYVNDGLAMHTPASHNSNHIGYGFGQCMNGPWSTSQFSMRVEVWDADDGFNHWWNAHDHLFSCWFDGNGALGYHEHACYSGHNWAIVGISIG